MTIIRTAPTEERRFVVLKPGETLLIGNVAGDGDFDPKQLAAVDAFFRLQLGVNVLMFTGDINVEALQEYLAAAAAEPATGAEPAAPPGEGA